MTSSGGDINRDSGKNKKPFRWNSLFDQSVDPVFVINDRGKIRYVNPPWEAMTGIPFAEVRNQKVSSNSKNVKALSESGDVPRLLRILQIPDDCSESLRAITVWRNGLHAANGERWQVTFMPVQQSNGTFFIGIIRPFQSDDKSTESSPVLPNRLLRLRDEHQQWFTTELFRFSGIHSQRILHQLSIVTKVSAPVWISGLPGTGKETLARIIHNSGPRSDKSFVALDCTRVPANLLEQVLKQSLAKESKYGSVFLSEADLLSSSIKEWLVEWLGSSDQLKRVICGSRQPISELKQDAFLALFGAFHIELPPLVDLRGQIPEIVANLLHRLQILFAKMEVNIHPTAMETLVHHSWPGNFAELHHVLRGALLRCQGQWIELNHLPFYLRDSGHQVKEKRLPPLDTVLANVEKRMIVLSLRECGGNKSKAAELLGLQRARLLRRITDLGLTENDWQS